MTNGKIQFSVVVPTYNPDLKIFETLESIKKSLIYFEKQSKIDYEILIINDGGNQIDDKINNLVKNTKVINLKKIEELVTQEKLEQDCLNFIKYFSWTLM